VELDVREQSKVGRAGALDVGVDGHRGDRLLVEQPGTAKQQVRRTGALGLFEVVFETHPDIEKYT